MRGGFGVYYDQPLIGHLPAERVRQPAVRHEPGRPQPAALEPRRRQQPHHGAAGGPDRDRRPLLPPPHPAVERRACSGSSTRAASSTWATSAPRGDDLIQPVDINQAQPADVVATNGVAQPRPALPGLRRRSTCGRRPATRATTGLLVGFRHDAGRAGRSRLAYTLSQAKTNATNDRDAVDLPQNPTGPRRRVRPGPHRPHPRLHRELRLRAAVLQGQHERPGQGDARRAGRSRASPPSGPAPPISRVVNGTTNGGRRGIRVNQIGDPFANLPANVPGGVY